MTFLSVRTLLYTLFSVIFIYFFVFCDNQENQNDFSENLNNSELVNIQTQDESETQDE